MATKKYKGSHGWKGALSYKAVGTVYSLTAFSSPIVGKILFPLFLIAICYIVTKF